jgi:hypothetical protein
MCLEMNVIQRELDFAFYDSIHLCENIIKICRNYFALINDLNNASINVSDLINSLHISIINYICKTENQLRATKVGFRRPVSSAVLVSVSAEWNEKTSVSRQQSNDQFLIALKNFLKSSSNTSIFLHTALSSVLIVFKKTRVSLRTITRTFLCFVLFLMLMSF